MYHTNNTHTQIVFRQPIAWFRLLLTILLGILLMNPVTAAPKFDITRPMPKVNFLTVAAPTCEDETQYWPALPNNPKADLYYRAARKIIGQRDTDNYRNSYILLREATKLGHWKAKILLADRYLQQSKSYYSYTDFKQSRAYIDELMSQGVPEAFYLMSQWRNAGYGGYTSSPSPASAYLYQAAELGHPQALVDVSNIFMNVKRQDIARKLLECGFKQGAGGRAANSLAISEFVNARTTEDFAKGFKYLFIGAKAGDAESIFGLNYYNGQHQKKIGSSYLADSKEYIRRVKIFTNAVDPRMYHDDPTIKRKNNYSEFRRVKGNVFLKFPNLDKVIPLPPAKLPPWNGDIGVAMTPQDAKDYHQDFDYKALIEEIKRGDIVSSSSEICPRSGYWYAVVPDKQQLGTLF